MKREFFNKDTAEVVEGTDAPTLKGYVAENVIKSSQIHTDDFLAYRGLPNHSAVNHSVSQYVNCQAHNNGVESFWSLLKHEYHGAFHKMSPKHMGSYVKESAHRHNIRESDTIQQMELVVQGMERKRLRYSDTVADNGLPNGAH